MKVLGKTLSYWWEKAGGLLLGIVALVIIWFIKPNFSNWKPFIVEFPAIGMCAFGFLLTFLGIILQGNSETIKWMINKEDLFNRFVTFNKKIVVVSFLLSLYACFLGYFDFQGIKTMFSTQIVTICKNILIGLFCGLFVWFITDTIQFIRIFYVLIRNKQ
ncbi:MAG: hypothetical protein CW341_09200 [Bacteroidetes bacterium]|nr:hypothetical protein [Bacteroidota bacterium]